MSWTGVTTGSGYVQESFNTGSDYYVSITRIDSADSPVMLCLRVTGTPPPSCSCNTFPQDPNNTCELVCNGGFENMIDFDQNPGTPMPMGLGELSGACPWSALSSTCAPSWAYGTSDLFGAFGNLGVMGTPVNSFGTQAGVGGTISNAGAYAGIYSYARETSYSPIRNYREYLAQQLKSPLLPNKWYTVSFYISQSDYSNMVGRNIGAYLTTALPVQNCILSPSVLIPNWSDYSPQNLTIPNSQLAAVHTGYLSNSIGWTLVSQNFWSGAGGQQYIIIGNFESDQAQAPIPDPSWPNPPANIERWAYYYIDDVSVRPAEAPLMSAIPNPVCPGNPVSVTALSSYITANWSWTVNPSAALSCNNNYCSTVTTSIWDTTTFTATATLPNYNGCTTTGSITVNTKYGPILNPLPDITTCLGQVVTLQETVTGYYSSSSWWVNNLGTLCTNCTSVSFIAGVNTQYAVFTATEAGTGCTVTDTVLINVTQLPGVSLIPTLGYAANILCENVQYSVVGAPAGSTYQWSHTSIPAVTGAVTGLGQYTVNWATAPVTSGNVSCTVIAPNGCTAILNLPVTDSCCYPAPLDRSIVLNNSNSAAFLNNILAQCPTCTVSGNTVTSPAPLSIAVHINGSFTINQNLILVNFGNIRMGTNAAIYIPAGKAFEMRTCTTNTYCGMMWDGIYVNGNTASFKSTQNTMLQQAKNAVVSNSGGIYTIENTRIRNCLKGVIVNSYTTANHLGIIRSTTIEMPGTFLPASPALPVSYNKTLIGIEINRVKQIAIGDATTAAQLNNV
ncbi:MAG: hypothetical protein HC867_02095 [Bacteroidia bacterium]|nr:hypothetical protein [Bacteroidia bacterium]